MRVRVRAAVGVISASCVAVSSPAGARDTHPGELRFERAGVLVARADELSREFKTARTSSSKPVVPRGIAAPLGWAPGVLAAPDVRRSVLGLTAIGRAGLEARGLVALNFLKTYRLTVDFETSILRFDPPGSAGAALRS